MPPPKRTSSVALWAGITTLFVNFAAINIVGLLGDETQKGAQAIAALITGICVAAGVYSKQRWDDAKAERKEQGVQ